MCDVRYAAGVPSFAVNQRTATTSDDIGRGKRVDIAPICYFCLKRASSLSRKTRRSLTHTRKSDFSPQYKRKTSLPPAATCLRTSDPQVGYEYMFIRCAEYSRSPAAAVTSHRAMTSQCSHHTVVIFPLTYQDIVNPKANKLLESGLKQDKCHALD